MNNKLSILAHRRPDLFQHLLSWQPTPNMIVSQWDTVRRTQASSWQTGKAIPWVGGNPGWRKCVWGGIWQRLRSVSQAVLESFKRFKIVCKVQSGRQQIAKSMCTEKSLNQRQAKPRREQPCNSRAKCQHNSTTAPYNRRPKPQSH